MVSKELIKYVKEHVAAGFSEDDIKLELVRHGHSVIDVEEALNAARAQQPKEKQKPKASLTKFLVLLTILIALGLVIFFVLAKIKAAEEIKSIEVKEDVILPVIAPPVSEAAPAPDALPEKAPPYVPPYIPPEAKGEKNVSEAKPAETAPQGREIPIYDVSKLSFNLTPRLQVVKSVSLENPDAAIGMCADFNRDAERDACFVTIAVSIPDNKLCGRITETILRDQCYLSFAVTGINACDKINDTVVKESCNKLIKLNLTGRID